MDQTLPKKLKCSAKITPTDAGSYNEYWQSSSTEADEHGHIIIIKCAPLSSFRFHKPGELGMLTADPPPLVKLSPQPRLQHLRH
ncbi:hypothetical protein MJO29_008990 [Puccinia striiformis f. sp. tritici]|nr:hypothetical protein MJO29_008990 [Puccinia striiformis f. sp. tritici]